MTRSQREIKKIRKYYSLPSFPASFTSTKKFRKALKDRLGIDIGIRELEDILYKDLAYQMSKVRPKNPTQRKIVANSVTVSAQVDTGFIHLKVPASLAEKNKEGAPKIVDHKFLMVIDILSRCIERKRD